MPKQSGANPKDFNLSIEQKVGQMILVGFEGTSDQCPGVKSLLPQIEKGLLGSLIFSPHIESPKQLKGSFQLSARPALDIPTFFALDQKEDSSRLRASTVLPSMLL